MERLDRKLETPQYLLEEMKSLKRVKGERKNRFVEIVDKLDGKIIIRVFCFNNENNTLNYVECLRVCEDGSHCARNLEYRGLAGWTGLIPNVSCRRWGYGYYSYYGSEIEEEDWGEFANIPNFYSLRLFENRDIAKLDGSLKYLMRKINPCLPSLKLLKTIGTYREHPELETLYQMGLVNVANDKRLFKMNKDKLKKVISFIKCNKMNIINDDSLSKILCCIKNDIKMVDYTLFRWSKGNKQLFKYVKNKNIDKWEYDDYIKMCKRCNHNVEDDYWKYPNDFRKAHDKVMVEYNRILEAERLAKERKQLKEFMKKENKIKNIAEKLSKLNSVVDGYMIYIPNSIDDISNQAKSLHQCLISADYVSKMARKDCILIFIKKDEEPIATAEIDYNKKLKQFYGNELDRNNCKPNEEVTNVFNQWLNNINVNKLMVANV